MNSPPHGSLVLNKARFSLFFRQRFLIWLHGVLDVQLMSFPFAEIKKAEVKSVARAFTLYQEVCNAAADELGQPGDFIMEFSHVHQGQLARLEMPQPADCAPPDAAVCPRAPAVLDARIRPPRVGRGRSV